MLTQITHDDIQNLQSVGRDAQAARKQYILRDNQDKVWAHLQSLSGSNGSRVDFVLDNGECHHANFRPNTDSLTHQLALR